MPIRMTFEECLLICNGIVTLLDPLVEKSKLWMVSQGNAQDQRIMVEGLLQLYVQTNQGNIVLHVVLHTKLGSALHRLQFVTSATNKAIMPNCVVPGFNLPQVHQLPIKIQADLGMAEVEAVEAVDPNMLCMKLKPVILQNL